MKNYVSHYVGRILKKMPIVIAVLLVSIMVFTEDKHLITVNDNLSKTLDVNSDDYRKAILLQTTVIESFNGAITAYGPDCKGCDGRGACSPRQDFRNNNIYYEDDFYGSLRVVAADRKYPCGTIVRINQEETPIYAVVLDRGSAIGFDKRVQIDLLFESEAEAYHYGIKRNINVEVLRLGW